MAIECAKRCYAKVCFSSSSSFFDFVRIFSLFFARISYLQTFGVKEFKKTIIPSALVGYETGYSQLGATGLVGYFTISYSTSANGIIVNYSSRVRVGCELAINWHFQDAWIE